MLIGHLPAGYIASHFYTKRVKSLICGYWLMLGSIFPDFDLLYFYTIDNRQHLHHTYLPHLPITWVGIFLILMVFKYFKITPKFTKYAIAFLVGASLHVLLDSHVGGMSWLHPFDKTHFYMIHVPNIYPYTVLNFVLHWTFLAEVGLCIWAIFIFIKKLKKRTLNKLAN